MKKHELTEKKVFSYLERHHMTVPHDKIVLGVSGGADSVCLLFLLLEYAKRTPLELAVVHVNHLIRPDAGEDAEYVRQLCVQNGIPFHLAEEDVRERARREKCSEEDAGRRVRYEAFAKVAGEWGARKIAVAHTCDDNAETMLMHLFRGSGLSGLCGIAPVRESVYEEDNALSVDKEGSAEGGVWIIRPLLPLRRQEIEVYLQEIGVTWRNDSTNESDDYARNRIRHHIMPYAQDHISQNAADRMQGTAELLRETEDFLEQETERALQRCMVADVGKLILCRDVFQTLHPAIQKRILFRLAKELSPTGKDISRIHVEDMLRVIGQEGNRSLNLPMGIRMKKQYDQIILEQEIASGNPEGQMPKEVLCVEVDFQEDGIYNLGQWGELEISRIYVEKPQELPQNQYTKWFDCDKINRYLQIRTRRQGDYLTIRDDAGGSRHKSLKDYMITEKIPKEIRDTIPVLAVGSHVLWLVGYRMSEDFKICENTKQILQAKLITREQAEQKTEEKDGRAD